MQTDQQVLSRLAMEVKRQEKEMISKGIELNPKVLTESSDEEEEGLVIESKYSQRAFQNEMSRTIREYEKRRQYAEEWYQNRIASLYKAYRKEGS